MIRKKMFDKDVDLINEMNEEIESWDNESIYIHLLELLGVNLNVINEDLPTPFPVRFLCSPETAITISMSPIFDAEMCGEEHFQVWPKSINYSPDDDRVLLSVGVKGREQ